MGPFVIIRSPKLTIHTLGKKNLIPKAKLSNEFNDLLDVGSLGPLGVVTLVDGLGVSAVKELLL